MTGHVDRSSRTRHLRAMFEGPKIIRAIGAHDALGARLGERAGFDAIWSSGLEVSASHGVPDADLLTMSELLDAARWMAGAVTLPVVADCDTGYGNATNVAHMVRRYEAAGIAAVCVEDKRFPKLNSFIPGRQELVPVREFAGKIEAAKNAQQDPDFLVIARIEALVVGLSVDEALKRGRAYADAGADAVLVHAKDADPALVLEFLDRWTSPLPVVVVPTTYFRITASELHAAGAKMVIYANHGLRARVRAVSETFREILRTDGTAAVENRIAPLETIFELQGVEELRAHDATYLRSDEPRSRAVLVSPEIRSDATADDHGPAWHRALRERQTRSLRQGGVDTVTMVGCTAMPTDASPEPTGARTVWHDDVAGLLDSSVGDEEVTLLVAGDMLFDSRLISRLLANDHHIVVAVHRRRPGDVRLPVRAATSVRLAEVDPRERLVDLAAAERVTEIVASRAGEPAEADADMIGLLRLSSQGIRMIRDAAGRVPMPPTGPRDLRTALSLVLAQGHPVHYLDCPGGWAEVTPDEASAHELVGR
ncbi:isocitrate lyase/phosphoenolpyruvate mutase family protein [Micromonospora aurantiaca]|uniref:isocitrate lyase/phosphoenolpyruvate mutase family protein n=1 Tax=Micromonospora aurantiaca (nom. illeg.) TaxID=47850 RepID=UPI00345554A0